MRRLDDTGERTEYARRAGTAFSVNKAYVVLVGESICHWPKERKEKAWDGGKRQDFFIIKKRTFDVVWTRLLIERQRDLLKKGPD